MRKDSEKERICRESPKQKGKKTDIRRYVHELVNHKILHMWDPDD